MSTIEIMLLYLDISRSDNDVFYKIIHYGYKGDDWSTLINKDFTEYSKEIKDIIIKKFPNETKLIFGANQKNK